MSNILLINSSIFGAQSQSLGLARELLTRFPGLRYRAEPDGGDHAASHRRDHGGHGHAGGAAHRAAKAAGGLFRCPPFCLTKSIWCQGRNHIGGSKPLIEHGVIGVRIMTVPAFVPAKRQPQSGIEPRLNSWFSRHIANHKGAFWGDERPIYRQTRSGGHSRSLMAARRAVRHRMDRAPHAPPNVAISEQA